MMDSQDPKKEAQDSLSGKQEENESFEINTAIIFTEEQGFWYYHMNQHWKKYSSDVSEQLELALQRILVERRSPDISSTPENLPDLQLSFKEFLQGHQGDPPFATDYFMVAYNKPIEEFKVRKLHWGGTKFYYLFYYDAPVIIERQEEDKERFELLFAFSLRQCDLTDMDDFLSYHHKRNFKGDTKKYMKFLKVIKRKYHRTLFTDETTESLVDWMNEAEKAPESKTKKIKTNLTVDELSYLFKALVENDLLSPRDKTQVFKFLSDNFETKAKKEISKKSLSNKFYSPPESVIEFWAEQFDKLNKFATWEKQKKSS